MQNHAGMVYHAVGQHFHLPALSYCIRDRYVAVYIYMQ